ncbi:MAG: hypothetical protein C5B50_06015 [Verrucomicrobia bacterium]|nr:MAG: hypothetical protein C5B50_06015 [Verrucomicrobiota bacterium]
MGNFKFQTSNFKESSSFNTQEGSARCPLWKSNKTKARECRALQALRESAGVGSREAFGVSR